MMVENKPFIRIKRSNEFDRIQYFNDNECLHYYSKLMH